MTQVSETFSWKFSFPKFLDCLLVTEQALVRQEIQQLIPSRHSLLNADDEQGSSDDTDDARGDITAGLSRSKFLVNRW